MDHEKNMATDKSVDRAINGRAAVARYRTCISVAVVAGAFHRCARRDMAAGYLKETPGYRGLPADAGPLESPELTALSTGLDERPMDEELQTRIRGVDLQIRKKYFLQPVDDFDDTLSGWYRLIVDVGIAFAVVAGIDNFFSNPG